jgi:hypothetical protein
MHVLLLLHFLLMDAHIITTEDRLGKDYIWYNRELLIYMDQNVAFVLQELSWLYLGVNSTIFGG